MRIPSASGSCVAKHRCSCQGCRAGTVAALASARRRVLPIGRGTFPAQAHQRGDDGRHGSHVFVLLVQAGLEVESSRQTQQAQQLGLAVLALDCLWHGCFACRCCCCPACLLQLLKQLLRRPLLLLAAGCSTRGRRRHGSASGRGTRCSGELGLAARSHVSRTAGSTTQGTGGRRRFVLGNRAAQLPAWWATTGGVCCKLPSACSVAGSAYSDRVHSRSCASDANAASATTTRRCQRGSRPRRFYSR